MKIVKFIFGQSIFADACIDTQSAAVDYVADEYGFDDEDLSVTSTDTEVTVSVSLEVAVDQLDTIMSRAQSLMSAIDDAVNG